MAKARIPSRKSGSFTLSWGLITIPLAVYKATDESNISRSMFTERGHRVGTKWYNKETGEDVAFADIVKKYESENGWVELEDSEIDELLALQSGQAELIGFMPNSHLHAHFLPKSFMQVRPDKEKKGRDSRVNPAAAKAFALLTSAMEAEGVFALMKVVYRQKSHICAMDTNGRMWFLHYDEEIRESLPMPQVEVSDAELEMATALVRSLEMSKPPALENTDAERIREFAKIKASGEPQRSQPRPVPQVMDLMAALKASVEAQKVG